MHASGGFCLDLLNKNEETSQGHIYTSEVISTGYQNNVKINSTIIEKFGTPI